jgi:hypothetical protein
MNVFNNTGEHPQAMQKSSSFKTHHSNDNIAVCILLASVFIKLSSLCIAY